MPKIKSSPKVGDHAFITVAVGKSEIKVEVTITKLKPSFGRERYVVAPVAGRGEMTVEKLEIIK